MTRSLLIQAKGGSFLLAALAQPITDAQTTWASMRCDRALHTGPVLPYVYQCHHNSKAEVLLLHKNGKKLVLSGREVHNNALF